MPSVTDWISSIGSLIGGLTGVGALVVAILSYRRSTRALAADARTRAAVRSTLDAVETLSRPVDGESLLVARESVDEQGGRVDYEAARAEARRLSHADD